MGRGLFALAVWLALADTMSGLDAESQRLADRYLSILESKPLQQIAFDRLWKIHADAGETEALIEACRKRSAENPLLFARVLQRAGRQEEAKRVLGEAAGAGDAGAAEMLAGMLEEEGEIRAAAELLERVLAAHDNEKLLVRLGELLQKAGETEKSRAALERAAALSPADLELRKRLAAASARAGDKEAAAGHLRVIAEHGSPSERFSAWGEISLRFEEAGRMSEAIAAQEALLGLMGPGHWQLDSARRRLFALHSENMSMDQLENRWLAEAETRPRDPLPALRMARLFEFKGDVARQRDWLVNASLLLPKDVRLACEIASLELSMGNLQAAADRYDGALAMRPGDADIIFLRAETAALLGQEADAVKRVEDYLAQHEDDSASEARAVDFYRRLRLSAPLEHKLSAAFHARPDDEYAATELARFYLEQRRDADAAECLASFQDSQLDPREAAAVASRFSELLKESAMKEEERRWARAAFEKDPSRPEYALRLADLLQEERQTDAMVAVLRQACEVAGSAPPREDLERRLFLALQSKGRSGSEGNAAPPAPSVKEMIALLDQKARRTGGEAAWLRLARWLRWADTGASPASALRRGLESTPQSAALQEALALELADSGDHSGAIEALKNLAQLAPERNPEIQRRIGHLELDRGNSEEGLRIFQTLADESKDWQAVADLALAQQMGGNWFDAFETWQRAYGLAPPGARRTIRASILNAATRLQLHVRGLDFFEKACLAEGETTAREELLNEAAAFAVEHGVAEEWRLRLERRTQASPEELAWREGLVFLFTAEGRAQEARQALKATAKVRGDSVEALERLLKLAENAGDWEEAALLARRLASLAGSQDPSVSMRYAGFLERAQKEEEAEGVWQMLAVRFARSPQVLSAAGDFFERSGKHERAEAFYRAAVRFQECAPQVHLRLGRFALDRGDRSQALADFERLLAQTRPEMESYNDCLPLPDRIFSAPVQPVRATASSAVQWKPASEADSEGCRLLAIREAGQLLARSPERDEWSESFSEAVERIWAKYYSGKKEAAFSEVEELASAGGGATIEQGFAALALEEQEADRLGRWATDEPGKSQARWENIVAAFSRMLEMKWRPDPEFLTRAFSRAPPLVRWQASESLADKGHLRTACLLGETVPNALQASQACSAWMQMAKWWIILCDPDKAINCLDQAIDSAPSSISYSEPLFAALRARWLLTPESRRSAFEEGLAGRLRAAKHRKCQAAAQALIASLKGNDAEAAEKIAEIVAELGTSEGESWPELFQQGGNQLEEWKLHRFARELYRSDLARDRALLTLRGENFQDSTARLLILNQFFTAAPDRISYLVNEWLARGPSDRELLDSVIRLQNSGRTEAAAAIYRRLCERNPRNEGICSGVLNLARIRLMRKAGAAFMERLLAEEFSGTGRAMTQTAALRLAGILDEDGEYDRSLALLNRLVRGVIPNKALMLQHNQALRRAGRHREALDELEGNPLLASLPEFTIPLAELYALSGRERDAFALLEREVRSSSASRRIAAIKLRELALEVDDPSRMAAAAALTASLSAESSPGKTPASEDDWKRALAELGKNGATEEERFRAGRSFLVLQNTLPANLRAQELERLKRITKHNPLLVPEFYILRKELADRFGSSAELLQQVSAEWDAGRGNHNAGEITIQILLDQRRYEELRSVLDEYLDDRHFNEQTWDQIGRRLLLDKQYRLAARVLSELNARASGDSARVLSLAEALSMSGKGETAAAMVASVRRVALVDPQRHSDLAEFFLKTDRAAEAKTHLLLAPRDARSGIAWIIAAERFLERGDFSEAREALLRAMESPQGVPTRALADYYWQSGEVVRLDPGVNEFDLPPRQFRALQIELASRFVAANDMDRAWSWLERISSLLNEPSGRRLLQSVEQADWNRAEKLWELPEDALWEARCGAAQFFLRRAEATESAPRALKDLERAHGLHPGSFSVARAYATKLLQQDNPAAARKVLRNVIDAWAEPGDRHAARQMLASLQASPSLPKGN